ncbi:MAG: four-helix bundle copper-binding protein [Pyrinomonadaceae bacterium]
MSHQERSQEMRTCIENCQNCHAVCLETISHCLEMGGKHAEAAHIRTLQDCVQSCITSADFMLRMSDFHPQVCGICADICERCAANCESLADGNDFMQRCAEACRRCAESCRQMSSMSSTASM